MIRAEEVSPMSAPSPRWFVIDAHADSLGAVLAGHRHLAEARSAGQLDFHRMRQAGYGIQFFSCWVEPEYKPERALARLLQYIDAFFAELAAAPDVQPITNWQQVQDVRQQRQLGAVLSVEGAEAVGTDPAMVRILHRLGVRLMSLTWNQRNQLADGAGEDPGGGGISRAGRAIVHEMNRVGMIVDVSHLAEAGFWDVLEISRQPVMASHSNCRRLTPHPRNLSDAQIRALAAQGGMQGITYVNAFLEPAPGIDRVVDHILHALDVVGNDQHVGLGSDFDGVDEPVPGLEDVSRVPALADRLSARGVRDETIRRIFADNFLDFLKRAWNAAIS
jgi:membrane dipeptidase